MLIVSHKLCKKALSAYLTNSAFIYDLQDICTMTVLTSSTASRGIVSIKVSVPTRMIPHISAKAWSPSKVKASFLTAEGMSYVLNRLGFPKKFETIKPISNISNSFQKWWALKSVWSINNNTIAISNAACTKYSHVDIFVEFHSLSP